MTDAAAESTAETTTEPLVRSDDPRARGILGSRDGDQVVLHLPHTDYRVHLQLADGVDGAALDAKVGKRVRGVVTARGMRFERTAGGGRFMEPVLGEPRIVTGTVLRVDREARRVLVDVAMPILVSMEAPEQAWDIFERGAMVTGYLHSGARFRPDAD